MPNVGDVYELVVSGDLATLDDWSAVFYYEVQTVTSAFDAEQVADDFVGNVLDAITDAMHTQYSANSLVTKNLMDLDDFNVTNPSQSGEITGNRLPTTVAMGFRGPWPGPGYNRAAHRLPLGVTGWIASDSSWSSSFETLPAIVAAKLGEQMVISEGTLDPVTVQKTYSGGSFVSASVRASALGTWEWNRWPTTQKGRQNYLWEDPNAA